MRKLLIIALTLLCSTAQATNIRAVRLQAPATNTTQDYTISGFGTVQAAIVFGGTAGDGADGAPLRQSFGFWDTTNVVNFSTHHPDGVAVASVVNRSDQQASNIVEMITGGTGTERTATISAVTDGVRLTWAGSDTSIQPYIHVILINGINGAQAGSATPNASDQGTTSVTTTGLTPKVVFGLMNRRNVADAASVWKTLSIGFAMDNGTSIEHGAHAWNSLNGGAQDTAIRRTNRIASNLGNETQDTSLEVSAMASGSFTIKTHNESGSGAADSDLGYLALDFDEGVDLQTVQIPTSAGDWNAVTSAGFTVDSTIAIITPVASTRDNTIENNNDAGAQGFYVANANEDFSFGCSDEDGVATSNASCRSDTQLVSLDDLGGTPEATADNPSFGSGSITFPSASFSPATQNHTTYFLVFEATAAGSGIAPIVNSHKRRRAQ